MRFDLGEARAILSRTPRILKELLSDLPDGWTHVRPRPGSWCPYDIVGHLIEGEKTDWIPRARIILLGDPHATFPVFDREAQEKVEEKRTLGELLDELGARRQRNLDELDSMQLGAEKLAMKATHPELGPVSLEQLLATWVTHDLVHIAQVTRGMAAQYREAVGPWNHPDYLRVVAEVELSR